MSDLISRQAAIDEANAWLLDCLKVNKQDRSCGLIRKLEDLPSTQLDIVRCKDCKHRDNYGCCKHWKGLAMGDIPIATDDNDFCSNAER